MGRFRIVRLIAIATAVPLVALVIFVLVMPSGQWLMAHGKFTPGHEELACADCHRDAPGTTRQQLQAKIAVLRGLRATPVDFGKMPTTSRHCLDCHIRPNERHPIYRFNEPRFIQAVAEIDARSCLTCHAEHQGQRVTTGLTFCKACHDELSLKSDPLDIAHRTLVARNEWHTCLGCHDFHGNHDRAVQTLVGDAITVDQLVDYFKAGTPIYAPQKMFSAEKTLE